MSDLILGPALNKLRAPKKARRQHADRSNHFDTLCKVMELWLKQNHHRPDWRTDPEWLAMTEEFAPLYKADYARRRAEEKAKGEG